MSLRGVKPTLIEKRLKMLIYGPAGAGKSTAALQFPKPYLIDCERGVEQAGYIDLIEKQNGVIFQTTDADELIKEVKTLLTEAHDFKTLIIDPLTIIYSSLLDDAEKKVGSDFGRHYSEANKKMKQLLNLLLRLDMNLIITSHSKNEYGEGMKVLGQTFDCYRKLDYLFDLVIEIQKRGKQRVGIVRKSRIKAFEEIESFPFSYEAIAEKYGRGILEKSATTQKLANTDQIQELKHLIHLLKVEEETTSKWLEKAQAASFDEMEEVQIQKCIDHLKSKITGKEAA